ncbi:MAG: ABC transporter ATP-binding protein [Thermodesulfobacteriota bacterium]
MPEPAIFIEGLQFAYGTHRILHDIRLDIPHAEFSVILGRNGCGKSTLLKLMAGLLPIQNGRIRVCGNDLVTMSHSQRGEMIGYLPQMHSPTFPFTVEEVVMTGRASHVFLSPGKEDREKVFQAMSLVGLGYLSKRPYTELSGGERQMVMIARLLAQEPRVILLDEPLTHLDPANQARLLLLIKALIKRELTVLAVLHDPNTAFLFADHLFFLEEGSVYTPQDGREPWDPEVLSRVYGTSFESIPYKSRFLVIPGSD